VADNIIPIASGSDFLAFIRDQAMPNGNLSARGVERCCGIANSSLIEGVGFRVEKLAQVLTSQGFQAVDLTQEGFPPQAVWLCIEYYAFESKAKAPMAKQLARTFGALGIMSTLKGLVNLDNLATITNGPSKELVAAREIRELTDLLDDNPRLAQLLTDSIANRTLEKALPAATLRGVAEIASELGFKVDASNRVKLGQFIKTLGAFNPTKESRLCNGVMMPINCYHDTPDLRTAIADFFG
jgi:hypothetical protein